MAASSTQKKHFPLALTTTLLMTSIVMFACRSNSGEAEESATSNSQDTAFEKAPLREGQSSLLDKQTSSSVNWQSWHKDLFKQANNERRIVFALIGSGTDINTLDALDQINQSASLSSLLKNNHITTLIDTNLHPDIEHYMALICMNSKIPADSPMLAWFSYEGNLVSWSPLYSTSREEVEQVIRRTSNTVQNLWLESPEYTLANSRKDHEARSIIRFPTPIAAGSESTPSLAGPISRNKSLFDPVSDTIDNTLNLTTARYIDLMVRASNLPELSLHQRQQCLQTAIRVANKMLIHGLIDPLDGGVFIGHQGLTHTLPKFSKTLRAQALSMMALYHLYQATQDAKYLKAANGILDYTQKHLALEGGGVALGISYRSDTPQNQPCLWTFDAIQKALTPQELDIATRAFGLSKLGNIPLIDDPKKIYYRKNSLTWKTTLPELAKHSSTGTKALTKSLEGIAKKLEALRSQKPSKPTLEKLSTASSLAIYSSACVSGFRATGNPSHLQLATETLTYVRDHFIDQSGDLYRAMFNSQLNDIPAKGADYVMVCQAALDIHEATLDPEWLEFAHKIHTKMNQRLKNPETGFIAEYDGTGYPRDYPTYAYYTLYGIDNDNTWAIANSNAKRLSLRLTDESLSEQANQLDGIMLRTVQISAPASIDYLIRESTARSTRVYLKRPISEPLLALARSKPCQIIAVSDSGSYPGLGLEPSEMKAGTATVILGDKKIGTAASPKELKALLSQ